MSGYLGADVAALARKDLRLELRARDTLPAMLLFVLATLVVFHFALPAGAADDAAYGLLWVALVFTALLGLARAWAPEREAAPSTVSCSPRVIAVRSGWARASRRSHSCVAAERGRPARVRAPVRTARRAPRSPGWCSPRSGSAPSARWSRRWPRPRGGREVLLPLLFLPLAIPLVVGGVGASVSPDPGTYLSFLGLYDAVFAILSLGDVRVRRHRVAHAPLPASHFPCSPGSPSRLFAIATTLIFVVAPSDADQGISQKIFYVHVPIALTAYACFGLGAWKALRLLWTRGERYDLESYTAIHQGTIFGALTLDHRLDLGEGVLGRVVVVELEPARPLPRAVPLLLRVLHAPLLGRAGRPA